MTSSVDTNATMPYSPSPFAVTWSTCGDVAPKNSTPELVKFFTVSPCTETGPTGEVTLKLESTTPWMHRPLKSVGDAGSKHGALCELGAVAGGRMTVARWPAPTMFRLLVISTLSW